jgi:hypothetical protein
MMLTGKFKGCTRLTALAIGALLAAQLSPLASIARAQSGTASQLSTLSALPIAALVAAPSFILAGGIVLTVVAVETSVKSTVWVLERASDGVRMSISLVEGSFIAAGTAILVTAISTGWLLSAAGRALAFVPNEIGAALLHNERITR